MDILARLKYMAWIIAKKDGNSFGWLCPKCQKIDMVKRGCRTS